MLAKVRRKVGRRLSPSAYTSTTRRWPRASPVLPQKQFVGPIGWASLCPARNSRDFPGGGARATSSVRRTEGCPGRTTDASRHAVGLDIHSPAKSTRMPVRVRCIALRSSCGACSGRAMAAIRCPTCTPSGRADGAVDVARCRRRREVCLIQVTRWRRGLR